MAAARRRNVLLITADQWRAECLSALGHPCVRTPNLDRLAARGVLFRNHFSQATPCSPGRASLYTGLYLHNHRVVVNGTPLDARHTNVALQARRAGYDPVLFGYTDMSADPRMHDPDDPALKTYEGVLPGMTPEVLLVGGFKPWLAHLKKRGYDVPAGGDPEAVFAPDLDDPDAAGKGRTYAPARYRAEDSNTAFLTDRVLEYLSVRTDEPWFVHLSYLSPHPPFVAPKPYNAMVDAADVPAPVRKASIEEEAAQHPWLAYYLANQSEWSYSHGWRPDRAEGLPDSEWRQIRATYYGMMAEVDANLGRVLAFLEETGQWDETLIVFTSDHGEQLGDHWMLSKFGYFDQTFRIPLIVCDPAGPESARGRTVDAFTENVDLMPTILEAIGAEVPAACDGRSLLPWLAGDTPAGWRAAAHMAFDFRDRLYSSDRRLTGLAPEDCACTILRGPRYKYVHFADWPALFFDLAEDPHEMHDLSQDPGHRVAMLEHAQELLSWRLRHDERALAHVVLTPEGVRDTRSPTVA